MKSYCHYCKTETDHKSDKFFGRISALVCIHCGHISKLGESVCHAGDAKNVDTKIAI